MASRRGERIGWIAGWLGGFLWVAILAVFFLFQGKFLPGLAGMLLSCAAVIGILVSAPWRHPTTPYWKLMIVPYGIFFISAAWAIWAFGGIEAAGLNWWLLCWLLPLFIPSISLNRRKWADSNMPSGNEPLE